MWLMVQRDEPSDYVLSTGECHSVKEFVEEVSEANAITPQRGQQSRLAAAAVLVYRGPEDNGKSNRTASGVNRQGLLRCVFVSGPPQHDNDDAGWVLSPFLLSASSPTNPLSVFPHPPSPIPPLP